MPVLKNIIFRRITALVLLALMLVVHGVKSLHRHTGTAATKCTAHGALAPVIQLSGHHCLICDFQLTRDADLPPEQFSFQPIRSAAETGASYVTSSYVAYLFFLQLRGPPIKA